MAQPFRKVVVITGASSGVGRAAALTFAKQGSKVVVAARRADALEELVNDCEAVGAEALAVPTDVSDEAAVEALAQAAVERFGGIDVWINNAAVTLYASFEESPPEAFRRVFDTNFFGYVHGARAAIPHLRRRHGVLINVASVNGRISAPFVSAYVASKFAIVGWSDALRMELRGTGVEVCTVLPAAVDTPFYEDLANYHGKAVKPVGPVHTPEQIAAVLLKVARKPRRQVIAGSPLTMKTVLALHALFPGAYQRIAPWFVQRFHFKGGDAVEQTSGSLFDRT